MSAFLVSVNILCACGLTPIDSPVEGSPLRTSLMLSGNRTYRWVLGELVSSRPQRGKCIKLTCVPSADSLTPPNLRTLFLKRMPMALLSSLKMSVGLNLGQKTIVLSCDLGVTML